MYTRMDIKFKEISVWVTIKDKMSQTSKFEKLRASNLNNQFLHIMKRIWSKSWIIKIDFFG